MSIIYEKFLEHAAQAGITVPAIDQKIGQGTQGEVYSILGDPSKVIKFAYLDSNIGDPREKNEKRKLSFLAVMKYLSSYYFSCFPKVYGYGVIDLDEVTSRRHTNPHISFSIWEKLERLPKNLEYMFDSIYNYMDRRESNFEVVADAVAHYNKSYNLNLDLKKFMKFYTQLICVPVSQGDMCGSNFMMNKDGDFKIIDFDRARLTF